MLAQVSSAHAGDYPICKSVAFLRASVVWALVATVVYVPAVKDVFMGEEEELMRECGWCERVS